MYDSPHQLTPMIPGSLKLAGLVEKAAQVEVLSARLQSGVSPITLGAVRALVLQMNSYYSNRIEGQSTHPQNIARALARDFSEDVKVARLQRLALAHIRAEQVLAKRFYDSQESMPAPLSSASARLAHETLYAGLPQADREEGEGIAVLPGEFRQIDVTVGHHVPPRFESLPRFLEHYDCAFAKEFQVGMRLVATACAHHRLVWIHPFADGNGRTARLLTQLSMLPTSQGLWSVNRGLARDRDAYYAALAAADGPRQGSLDGRGNLSEKALCAWVDFFLDTCLDQIRFLHTMLDLAGMRRRIEALVQFMSSDKSTGWRPECVSALTHLFYMGEMPAADFLRLTGLGDRTSRSVLAGLLKDGIVSRRHLQAPLHFEFPLHVLPMLLPGLYPEAAAPALDA